jgi:hypothetical protein
MVRQSPAEHAGECKNIVKRGKKDLWVSKPDKNGTYRWVRLSGSYNVQQLYETLSGSTIEGFITVYTENVTLKNGA